MIEFVYVISTQALLLAYCRLVFLGLNFSYPKEYNKGHMHQVVPLREAHSIGFLVRFNQRTDRVADKLVWANY
jgi:hypothetical protein